MSDVRRRGAPLLAVTLLTFWTFLSCTREQRADLACVEPARQVIDEIRDRVGDRFELRGFAAVKASTTQFEQLYFISARAVEVGSDRSQSRAATATWAADAIDVVRLGPLSSLEPIILNANDVARAATPSLRWHSTREVWRPGANSVAAQASQRCLAP